MTSTILYFAFASLVPIILLTVLYRLIKRIRDLHASCQAMLREKELIFGFVHDVAEVFADADSIELLPMLKRVMFYALRTARASAGAVYMCRDKHGPLHADVISGLFPPMHNGVAIDEEALVCSAEQIQQLVRAHPVQPGEGVIGEVAHLGAPLLIEDAERDARVPHYEFDALKLRSVLLIPMRFHQEVLGVMVLVNRVDGKPFSEADVNLVQALADQASVSIHFVRLREALNERQQIEHDLEVARSIQASLLPKTLPRIPGFELAAFNHPAMEIGGDYYDVFEVDEEHIGLAVLDVSGKGIGGAIMTTLCRSVLRAQSRGNRSPAAVLREVNRLIEEDIAEDMFVTLLYMVLNTRTRELTLARGGHERPLLVSPGRDDVTAIASKGAALGMVEREHFDRLLNEVTLSLEHGTLLVAYSDGITEAQNAEGEEWGIGRFCAAVREAAPEGAHSVLNLVRQRLMSFVGDIPQYDDMTLIALRAL